MVKGVCANAVQINAAPGAYGKSPAIIQLCGNTPERFLGIFKMYSDAKTQKDLDLFKRLMVLLASLVLAWCRSLSLSRRALSAALSRLPLLDTVTVDRTNRKLTYDGH
jgi:hypothetical protein